MIRSSVRMRLSSRRDRSLCTPPAYPDGTPYFSELSTITSHARNHDVPHDRRKPRYRPFRGGADPARPTRRPPRRRRPRRRRPACGRARRRSGNPAVSAVELDLASLESIREGVAGLGADLDAGNLPPLGGVVANAGLQMTSTSARTADGIEMTFGVNVVANVALLAPLLPRLTAPGRIVITASDVHFGDFKHTGGLVPAPRWDEPQQLAQPGSGPDAEKASAGRRAYATSKLADIYLVHALARRLRRRGGRVRLQPGPRARHGPRARRQRRSAPGLSRCHATAHGIAVCRDARAGRRLACRGRDRPAARPFGRLHRPNPSGPVLRRVLRRGPRGGAMGVGDEARRERRSGGAASSRTCAPVQGRSWQGRASRSVLWHTRAGDDTARRRP